MGQRGLQEVFLVLFLLEGGIRMVVFDARRSHTFAKDGRFEAIFLRVAIVIGRTIPSSSGTFILRT
jgi:hypothetical protein